jgi:hypothetical protein
MASLLFLAAIITLGLFFLKKKFDFRSSGKIRRRLSGTLESEIDLSLNSGQNPTVTPFNVPQNYDPGSPHPYYLNANPSFDANPFQDPPSQPKNYQIPSQYPHPAEFQSSSQHHSFFSGYTPESPVTNSSFASRTGSEPIPPQSTSSTSASISQRKAAMAGVRASQPPRFVVHTDADDDLPQPNNDGVIELPPQYSERRHVANPTPDANAGHPPGTFHL